MIGTTLSHFKITAKLGEGGMGEVYRADDSKLGREVAIKVLPEAVASDPERLARFEREAKVLASLNHPNIAAIYAIESTTAPVDPGARLAPQEEGEAALGERPDHPVHFLVMELVEGEDLKERLERGALPYSTVQPIALQVAEALEVAHEKGIIHRDLKPANIKVTPEGQVKVLDFGLAKALAPESVTGTDGDRNLSPLSLSPTLTAQMTQAGVLMGTAAYMSPEQARGQQVDQQADIWAYGAVLYEMLTGRIAFPGATVTDVMAAIVTHEPAWDALPAETPRHIRELLRLCMAKDPHHRIHAIGDARLLLNEPSEQPSEVTSVEQSGLLRRLLPWGLAALMAIIAVGFALSSRDRPTESAATQRFSITLPPEIYVVDRESLALSPDGSKLVFVGHQDGRQQLFLRRLDSSEITPLPETEGGHNPFFSPDGETLGFTIDNGAQMNLLSLAAGRKTLLAETQWGGGSWGPDDMIVYTPTYVSGLHSIPASGGTPQELTRPDPEAGELGHFWPVHLPEGDTVLFTIFSVPLSRSSIQALDLKTGEVSNVIENAVFGRYASSGHLLFVRDHTLMAARFDPATLIVTGAPYPVIDDVIPDIGQGDAPLAVAANGTIAYLPGRVIDPPRQLAWVDRAGLETPIAEARRYGQPRISPDGTRIALTIEDRSWDLWALELDRGTLSRLSFEPATQFGVVWAPSGDQIIYSQDDPPYNIFRRAADGTSQPEQLLGTQVDNEALSISPDGKLLIYSHSESGSSYDLRIMSLDDPSDARSLVETPFSEYYGSFSPDGNWIAFKSNETGTDQVYVQRFPDGGRKLQVSLDGGSRPLWSRDGRELFFRDGPRMMAVEVSTGERFTAGQPRELFSGSYMASSNRWDYDVAPDGRFIMIKTPDEDRPREISVVLNWFQELEELVPAD